MRNSKDTESEVTIDEAAARIAFADAIAQAVANAKAAGITLDTARQDLASIVEHAGFWTE